MCHKRISTESGVLTCDRPEGHDGNHHADHPGGPVRDPYEKKSTSPTPYQDDRGNYIMEVFVKPLHIEWPQDAKGEPVRTAREHPREAGDA